MLMGESGEGGGEGGTGGNEGGGGEGGGGDGGGEGGIIGGSAGGATTTMVATFSVGTSARRRRRALLARAITYQLIAGRNSRQASRRQ